MGRYGFRVIDADGHGGEAKNWREKIPPEFRETMERFRQRCAEHYGRLTLPGGGTARRGDDFEMRPGMYDPEERLRDMDLEGIDVTVTFPGGAGEEWAMLDRDFAVALCRTMNDAKAEFCRHAPDRIKAVAKLPMIDPEAAAAELRRAVTELGLVGMVTPQHIRDKNLDDPSFDVVWAEAERLGAAVCVHGGGQAPDQYPIAVDRFRTRLEVHAITHPLGNMIALDCFTVGGILHRFPKLRVAFMESGCGWLPFWLERLDEHYELMPEQAPNIDRKPSEYFLDGNCFIGCDPDEQMLGYVAKVCGDHKIVYASDYYHWDCKFPNTVKLIAERNDLSRRSKERILGENASVLYGIPF
ncbi:MAG: amidohydrolase [Candidatus Binatia bacterium]|nr:MAG: amidohydrolase [Candidatus Binatia bacterium]